MPPVRVVNRGYRIEWRWLAMGPLLGFFCGFVAVSVIVGYLLVWGSPLAALLVGLPAGAVLGGPIGAGVGLVAGVPFAFLVGPHLSLRTASRRAWVLGAALPPLVMLLAATWLPAAAPWSGSPTGSTLTWLDGYCYLAAAFLGGVTAEVTVKVDMPRATVS